MRTIPLTCRRLVHIVLIVLFVIYNPSVCPARSAGDDIDRLVRVLMTMAQPLVSAPASFAFRLTASADPLPDSSAPASGTASPRMHSLVISRLATDSWCLALTSPWRDVVIRRSANETRLELPRADMAIVGTGAPDAGSADSLAPVGLMGRLFDSQTSLSAGVALLMPSALEAGIRHILLPHLKPGYLPCSWTIASGVALLLPEGASAAIRIEISPEQAERLARLRFFRIELASPGTIDPTITPQSRRTVVPRDELERMILRGLRRIFSLKFPGPGSTTVPEPLKVAHGELRHHEGQLLVLLSGSPAEIGTAHGKLLGPLVRRTVDSSLHLVGLVETIEKGIWFPGVLEDSWKRLSPHIPVAHLAEMAALASACPDLTWQEIRLANMFPEYFHCSGFAVFGRATADGRLYHGRVLDYMTEIGLQHAAVSFVVKPEMGHGYLNVGYAGLVGAVSGMNDAKIALGEMGGGGRFQWNGAPMATLMRRALEECGSLSEVKKLWESNPRTCEYFYVWSDGNIPSAVGVKATPAGVEFVHPGQAHPMLGEGIADTVVLSAGKRLKLLRERVIKAHGGITASSAISLMNRPVAMRSNLHNVLFAPQSLEAWVAHADELLPAADRPYVRYDLNNLLGQIPGR